jgi:hypothetical protein
MEDIHDLLVLSPTKNSLVDVQILLCHLGTWLNQPDCVDIVLAFRCVCCLDPIQLHELIDIGRQEHSHGVRVFRGLARRVFFTALLAIVVWTVCQFHGTAVDITQVLEGFPLSFIDYLQIALAYRISRIYCMLC